MPGDPDSLVKFIKLTPPAKWVDWWFRVQGTPAAQPIKDVLFEAEKLRSLDVPEILEQVVACALSQPALLAVIQEDFDKFVDEMAEELIDRIEKHD